MQRGGFHTCLFMEPPAKHLSGRILEGVVGRRSRIQFNSTPKTKKAREKKKSKLPTYQPEVAWKEDREEAGTHLGDEKGGESHGKC